jgi:ubiquinone/menaquinone biosynthesis C-methylase UbiE
VAVDVAENPLKSQKKRGRETVLASVFQLPFSNESIDGGVIILNLFNASFKDKEGKEILITLSECGKILKEVYRILKKGSFVIINIKLWIFHRLY